MRRRQILKLGAACALAPIGCGGGSPEPQAASAPAAVNSGLAETGPAPSANAAPASAAPSAAPSATSDAGAAQAAADEARRASYARMIARVGKNHGHVLTVSLEDVKAGAEKSYDLRGAAAHPHSATLTAEDMKKLLAGEVLRTKSTTDLGHTHRLLVRCAPAVDPPEWVSVVNFASSGKDEHEIVITAADVAAKAEKSYDIQGLAGHNHQVTLSAADFEKLIAGGTVTLHSTRDADDAHLHALSITLKKPAKG